MRDEERKGKIGDPLHRVYETIGGDSYVLRYCPECAVLYKECVESEPVHPLSLRIRAPLRRY